MTWIKTTMKPEKVSVENPDHPVSSIFHDVPWKLSGGTKQACVVSASLILALDIGTVVEIGAWQGFSSLMLGRALATNAMDDGAVQHAPLLLTVDINTRALERSRAMTNGLPIEHRHVQADSMEVDLREHLAGRIPRLCFIDGNHDYEHCKNDMELCADLLPKWGVLVVHDYSGGFPGVVKAVNGFLGKTGWQSIYLDENRCATDYKTIVIQRSK